MDSLISFLKFFDPELSNAVTDGFASIEEALDKVRLAIEKHSAPALPEQGDQSEYLAALESIRDALDRQALASKASVRVEKFGEDSDLEKITDGEFDLAFRLEEYYAKEIDWEDVTGNVGKFEEALDSFNFDEITKAIDKLNWSDTTEAVTQIIGKDWTWEPDFTDGFKVNADVVKTVGLPLTKSFEVACYEVVSENEDSRVTGYDIEKLMKYHLLLHVLNKSYTKISLENEEGEYSGNSLMKLAVAHGVKQGISHQEAPFGVFMKIIQFLFGPNMDAHIDFSSSDVTSVFVNDFDQDKITQSDSDGWFMQEDGGDVVPKITLNKNSFKLASTLRKVNIPFKLARV